MSIKTKVISIIIVLSIGIYAYVNFTSLHTINVSEISSFDEVQSKSLIETFLIDEEKADKTYVNKVIEITGIVKEVSFLNNRNTLILQGDNDGPGIICDMNPGQLTAITKIRKGERVRVKGICKGFLKDVIILNCILTDQQPNE